jgi:hypothetical protein
MDRRLLQLFGSDYGRAHFRSWAKNDLRNVQCTNIGDIKLFCRNISARKAQGSGGALI